MKRISIVAIGILSAIGFISLLLFIFGYRPIRTADSIPDWTVIDIMATITLSVLTLVIAIRISGIENRSQEKQLKLAAFEQRYSIYESLTFIFTFAEMLKSEKNVIELVRKENYVTWFDKNAGNHNTMINRLHKSSLLFPELLSTRIILVLSASQCLFLILSETYDCSPNHSRLPQWETEIVETCDRILKNRFEIEDQIEDLISLGKV